MSMTVACVLRRSSVFDVDYVAHLRDGVLANLPDTRFVCLSDVDVPCERIPLRHGWPAWWAKVELFRPDLDDDLLYFDLDTKIIGDLRDVSAVRGFTMLSDFFMPARLASGMMMITTDIRERVWRAWHDGPPTEIMRRCAAFDSNNVRGDQKFLGDLFEGSTVQRWQDIVPDQIVSYKANIRRSRGRFEKGNGTMPPGVRVVCFHGKPRPRDLKWEIPL